MSGNVGIGWAQYGWYSLRHQLQLQNCIANWHFTSITKKYFRHVLMFYVVSDLWIIFLPMFLFSSLSYKVKFHFYLQFFFLFTYTFIIWGSIFFSLLSWRELFLVSKFLLFPFVIILRCQFRIFCDYGGIDKRYDDILFNFKSATMESTLYFLLATVVCFVIFWSTSIISCVLGELITHAFCENSLLHSNMVSLCYVLFVSRVHIWP